jgi:large subunit ribosomal protein L9
MKLILSQSYMNLGEIGDIVDVKPGYARNFLIPQGIAKRATAANLRALADQAKKLEIKKAEDLAAAQKTLAQIEGMSLRIIKKVSEDGRLYGSVTTKEVEAAFAEKGVTIDRRQVVLGQQIKMAGDYSILVKLFGNLKANVKLSVSGEDKPGASAKNAGAKNKDEKQEKAEA